MGNNFFKKVISSKSKIAMILRLLAWFILVVAIIAGIGESIEDAEPVPLILYTAYAAGTMLLLYSIAAIINYLAEITEILKNSTNADADKH